MIRGTYLHGFENPLLHTAGERYKERRRRVRITTTKHRRREIQGKEEESKNRVKT
jgi:hypothetical protein